MIYTSFRCVAIRQVGPWIQSIWAEQQLFGLAKVGALSRHQPTGEWNLKVAGEEVGKSAKSPRISPVNQKS